MVAHCAGRLVFDAIGHSLVAGRFCRRRGLEPVRRRAHSGDVAIDGVAKAAWKHACAASCPGGAWATAAPANAPITSITPPTRIANSVIVVVLSEPCAVRRHETNLEHLHAVRQAFLTDGPVGMPNRTDGSTNEELPTANSQEDVLEVGNWTLGVDRSSLVTAAGRFVKSWRRLTATHGRMNT